MATLHFTDAMAKAILEQEDSDQRFETFCVALLGDVESLELVTTSRGGDRGRDGLQASVKLSRGGAFVLCSLQKKNIVRKASDDLEVLQRYSTPQVLHYCFTQDVKQETADEIEGIARTMVPSLHRVHVHGMTALVGLCRRHPEHFERHYRGELDALRQNLVDAASTGTGEINGLRIALTTQLSRDASALRREVSRNLVLSVLADSQPRSLREIADCIRVNLALPGRIREHYLVATIEDLADAGLVGPVRTLYQITPAGQSEVVTRISTGATTLLEGRAAVGRALRAAPDTPLTEREFSAVWQRLQEGISVMFLAHGLSVTSSIAAMASGLAGAAPHADLTRGINEIAQRVHALRLGPDRAAAVATAIVRLFADRDGEGFKWLSNLCLVYLSMCSLGLDPDAQEQVLARLRDWEVLLDTHVLLSYLSKGDRQHVPVSEIMSGCRDIGVQILVSMPVVEETAYHAWIAGEAFRDWWTLYRYLKRQQRSIPADRMAVNVGNAFLAGFLVEADGAYSPRRWREYIGNFRGASGRDTGPLTTLLQAEGMRGVGDDGVDEEFAFQISAELGEMRAGATSYDGAEEVLNRCQWDGRLLGILERRRSLSKKGGRPAVILSSSGRLRAICDRHAARLGMATPVISVAALAYVLALTPRVSMSLGSLRAVLFETDFARYLPPLERIARRVLRRYRGREFSLARTPALQAELDSAIDALGGRLGDGNELA
jgi:hypothetical protein